MYKQVVNLSSPYSGWRFDIMKGVLAVFIVLLHSELLPHGCDALLTVAVPLFFMISSYLFWTKVDGQYDKIPQLLYHFVKRNLKLYFFWIVVFAIPSIFINRYFFHNIGFGRELLLIVRDFFFFGVFPSSWFLMALPFGMTIISFLVYKLNFSNALLVCLSCVSFLLCWIDEGGAKSMRECMFP